MRKREYEGLRLKKQYQMLDKMLMDHGGDFEDMMSWIFSKHCSSQFPTKYDHDVLLTDFNKWSRNRGILEE
jgi:hypothetical protein|tara:strand:- start:336 stop:548 length:213 start_codon:yes stop_codon:yes gene_type:complete